MYDIGEQFLDDPTSTLVCSDRAFEQSVRWWAKQRKRSLARYCPTDEAQTWTLELTNDPFGHAVEARCDYNHLGERLYRETQKKFDAFMACRRYWIEAQ